MVWDHQATNLFIQFQLLEPREGRRVPVLDCMVWPLALLRLWRPTGRRQQQNSRGGGVNGIPDVLCSSVFGLRVIFFGEQTWKDHIVDQHKFYIIGSMRDSNSILLRLNYRLICFGRLWSTYELIYQFWWSQMVVQKIPSVASCYSNLGC